MQQALIMIMMKSVLVMRVMSKENIILLLLSLFFLEIERCGVKIS